MSAVTDVGIKKQVNQDSLAVRRLLAPIGEVVFAILCDGMGGLEHGEIASCSITSAFCDWAEGVLPQMVCEPVEDSVLREQWTALIQEQNEKIRAYGTENECTLGSTVTALLLTPQRYYVLNIGDSRTYEIGVQVKQLTEDHTVVEEEVRRGNLTPEQAALAPMKNVLTRCVGVTESVYPDLFFGETVRDTTYMLCSDGFRHRVMPEEMQAWLLPHTQEEIEGLEQRAQALVELNKQRGETDNISVIAIYVK